MHNSGLHAVGTLSLVSCVQLLLLLLKRVHCFYCFYYYSDYERRPLHITTILRQRQRLLRSGLQSFQLFSGSLSLVQLRKRLSACCYV